MTMRVTSRLSVERVRQIRDEVWQGQPGQGAKRGRGTSLGFPDCSGPAI